MELPEPAFGPGGIRRREKSEMKMEKYKSTYQKWMHYILIGFVGISVLFIMGYSIFSSNRMVNTYAPLADAAMEVKLETTTAHLWFEEKISGDRFASFDEILGHIDTAKWYAAAMLEGGRNTEGEFKPLRDPVLRQEVKEGLEYIERFERITHKRYEAYASSGIGTEIDQQYDRVFKLIIHQLDDVETLLQQKIRSDFGHYKAVQILLMIVAAVLSMIAVFSQFRHDREMKKSFFRVNEARERAEESEVWLKTTMNSMGDAVIITDHKGCVTYLNPVASSLTGWLLSEARDRKMTEVFHIVNEYTKEPVEDPVNMVIRNNVVVGLANHTELISKDGKVWPISDSAAPIFDQDRNLRGVVVVFHEISAQKKAEAEKTRLETQLRQTFKMEAIGTMAGGIAHDFNNILAMILGNADMARDGIPAGNSVRHNVDEILKAATRAKDLVKQILSFSRQETHKKEPVYLCRFVEESMKSLRSAVPASVTQRVLVPGKCGGEGPECHRVLADPTQLHQLLLNLCVNAVQAMDEKGVLEIKVGEGDLGAHIPPDSFNDDERYVHLSVSDTGCGIRPEMMDRIFDPFFTTKEVGEGTGMGLSVVHGIVEGHGGRIYVESEEGEGATFHVYFPVTHEKAEPKAVESGPLPMGNETILFVDDEKMIVDIGKEIIESQGYAVTAFTDSVEALELFKEDPEKFDLVVTDQTMPNMTGAELAEQLLRIKPDLPIILCTGYSNRIDKTRARKLGIGEFAEKPFIREDMLRLIRKLLDAS